MAMSDANGKTILKTERLIFAEAAFADASFILDLLTQPSFLKYIGSRGVGDLETARDYIRDLQLQYRINGYGSYVVRLKDQDIPIGISGLIKRDSLEHADIGFAYHPDYWRKGYALEGAEALLQYGRDKLGLDPIIAITSPDNTASQKLLLKLGLVFDRKITMTGKADETWLYVPSMES